MDDNKTISELTREELEELINRYPWFGCAQRCLAQSGGEVKDSYKVPRLMINTPITAKKEIATEEFGWSDTDRLIDEFIISGEHKVVATDLTPDKIEGIDVAGDVADDDLVTEELAEIYVKQQLYEQAMETYRKLSLLDPKKSVYFAEIIENLEKNTNN